MSGMPSLLGSESFESGVVFLSSCNDNSRNYPNQIYEHGKKIIRDKIIPVEYGKRVPNRTKKKMSLSQTPAIQSATSRP